MLDILWPIVIVAMLLVMAYSVLCAGRYIDRIAESSSYAPNKLYYTVSMNADEIYQSLMVPYIIGDYKSVFLLEERRLIIRHKLEVGGTLEYVIAVTEMENYSVLVVSPTSKMGGRAVVLDPDIYFAKKLGAIPIPNDLMKP